MSGAILVVEDELVTQKLIAVNLERAGHTVMRAANVPEAVAAIREVLPDLVLLDWILPKATEFRLLHFFMTHPDRVYSRAQLLDEVWGDHVFVEERTVDVHIRRVRQVLAPSNHQDLIETVRGMGYRFRRQLA